MRQILPEFTPQSVSNNLTTDSRGWRGLDRAIYSFAMLISLIVIALALSAVRVGNSR
jgi:hypothetical protein